MRRRGEVDVKELLLRIDPEVDPRRELEVELLAVGSGTSTSPPAISASSKNSSSARVMSSGAAGSSSSVISSTDPRVKRPPMCQLEQAEAVSTLDDDVHRAVLECFEHLLH